MSLCRSCDDVKLLGSVVASNDLTDDDVDGSESLDSRSFLITAFANNGGIFVKLLVSMLSLFVSVNGGSEQISFHSSPSLQNRPQNKNINKKQ